MHRHTRRALLQVAGAGLAAGAIGSPARASDKPPKLTVLAHRVHQLVSTEGPGGDATKAWRDQNGIALEWVTLDLNAIRDRLLREASLSHTGINVGFLLNTAAVPEVFSLLQPLNPFMAASQLDAPADIAPNFMSAFAHDGVQYGVPFRQAVNALHWNGARFAERGVEGPPATIGELLDVARKLSFTAKDGTRVYALASEGDNYSTLVMIARAFGGDLITDDYRVVADQPPAIEALKLMRALYAEKLTPPNVTAMTQNDLIGAMQQGQVAMEVFPFGRTVLFNDPKTSKFPGQFHLAMFPGQLPGQGVSTAEFWGMVIPKTSSDQDWSWSLIRDLTSRANTVTEAINGNGPVRISADSDPRLQQQIPYAAMEAAALKSARVPLPAFGKAAQAKDIIVEAMQAAMLGMQSPEAAAKSMAQRLRPLMPA